MPKLCVNLGLILGLILVGCNLQLGKAMPQQIDKSNWNTHCLGRYLVDLPTGATVDGTYKFAHDNISTSHGVSENNFRDALNAKEKKLKDSPHDEGGSLFIRRTDIDSNHAVITSWSSDAIHLLNKQEYYAYFPIQNVKVELSGETNSKSLENVLRYYANELTPILKYRASREIPKHPGFCFNNGFIADNKYNNEEVKASIGFKQYHGVTMSILAFPTSKPGPPLLERLPQMPDFFVNALAQAKTLRKKDHPIGNIQGQELVTRAEEDGKTAYVFTWQSQGKADSLKFQKIVIDLSTADKREHGKIIDAPFKDDDEALEFWDAILESFRLRPGAV